MFPLETCIVGDEEVNSGSRSKCQLHGVWGAKRSLTTEPSVDSCRFGVKGKHLRRRRNGFLVPSAKFLVPMLDWFNENFAERQRGSQELIAACQHFASKVRYPARKLPIVLK